MSPLTSLKFNTARRLLNRGVGPALFACMLSASQVALAQSDSARRHDGDVPAFAPAMIDHMQKMRRFRDVDKGGNTPPSMISRYSTDRDETGEIATFQPGGATLTANNAFFQDIGTNGRTCFTCHQPQNGWSVSAENVAARFAATGGKDPIFRLVDGATCPNADVSTLQAKRRAYKLLTEKGLIRIGLPLPAGAEFVVTSVNDPYNCTTNPTTGLTSPSSGIVSIYRRPLPSANLGFLSAVMWDGREPNLRSQALDATLGHAQADAPPSPAQVEQIFQFETGVFSAQVTDKKVGSLHGDGAKGGPIALSLQNFFIGVNDPLGQNPTGTPSPQRSSICFVPGWACAGETTRASTGRRSLEERNSSTIRGSISRASQV